MESTRARGHGLGDIWGGGGRGKGREEGKKVRRMCGGKRAAPGRVCAAGHGHLFGLTQVLILYGGMRTYVDALMRRGQLIFLPQNSVNFLLCTIKTTAKSSDAGP